MKLERPSEETHSSHSAEPLRSLLNAAAVAVAIAGELEYVSLTPRVNSGLCAHSSGAAARVVGGERMRDRLRTRVAAFAASSCCRLLCACCSILLQWSGRRASGNSSAGGSLSKSARHWSMRSVRQRCAAFCLSSSFISGLFGPPEPPLLTDRAAAADTSETVTESVTVDSASRRVSPAPELSAAPRGMLNVELK